MTYVFFFHLTLEKREGRWDCVVVFRVFFLGEGVVVVESPSGFPGMESISSLSDWETEDFDGMDLIKDPFLIAFALCSTVFR
jgi:hypothetical protein